MEILDYRPLVIFLIEVILAVIVFRRGKFQNAIISIFILFLAGYQLGEFLILTNPSEKVGFQIAFFFTTLLPPIAVLILEKISQRNFFSYIFFAFGAIFSSLFVLMDKPIVLVEKCYCFAKFGPSQGFENLLLIWGIYYLSTLAITFILNLHLLYTNKKNISKFLLKSLLFTNILIFPFSYLLMIVFRIDLGYATSIMCSMGLFGAITMAYASLKYSKN